MRVLRDTGIVRIVSLRLGGSSGYADKPGFKETHMNQNHITAVHEWWKSHSISERGALAIAAGYDIGWGAFQSISLNKYEVEALARVLMQRGVIG